ncbi:hypothetical protein LTR91_003879 [Friedmanniomyces endolithicus]|uniref:Zn(2)-C6 fungal-type domain-containing protein n=1 Tax=Friedmanniomyces endolithicus TaxID=329885 RepID=A0AAN6KX79_9PEZI|nr:hypothetical protein LTR35_007333 [Friedmanniomyces endolithicus]KAK0297355.1 hypothetical protein LTS00_004077 [Friedmanniomyces endolithicus]KAK0315506.1 hypothetical protein LTR01_000805 [Friedmanniomyces endolithicus]KAK0927314.1 hypothetical protein LTR57_003476 [Friedmanniomyces endolithicus]KAK0995840.1 hypothetical protein LTS01_006536 [Friedmanniomyces endolithicus]
MPESPTAPNKRACDACHRRKVKCICIGDGTRPCKNCTSAGLACTYNTVPQKKGPKGSRAKVISELREKQRQSQLVVAHLHNLQPQSAPYLPRKGLISIDMITICVEYFFLHLYSTQPVLQRTKVGETIGRMETDAEAYCLVMSLCAYMMIQPNLALPASAFDGLEVPPQSSFLLGQLLLKETVRVRKCYDYVENPTVWTVITSFFIFGSNFCLDRHNTAWFHLREATTLAHVLGMHEESAYLMTDVIESSRRRRLYWLLFVTERAYALQKRRPLTLYATINLPTLEEDPSETVELNGFLHLVNLFRPFDDTFVGIWNKAKSGCTTQYLAQLQQQLSDALPVYLNSTESQAVDLRCSQQWLRTMVWQLSISHGFLSSAAAENAMSFKFPVEVARDLVASTSHFSQQSMEVHGIGLIEKLFDVACTLTDVMSCVPIEPDNFSFGPQHYLHQLTTLISTLRGGQQRYTPLLLAKISLGTPSIPSTPTCSFPALSLTSLTAEDLYDGSQEQSSGPESCASTSFGSPPLSAPATFGFRDMEIVRSPPPPLSASGSAGFGLAECSLPFTTDLAGSATAPGHYFQDVAMDRLSGAGLKYESDG